MNRQPPPVPEGLPRNRKCDCGCRRPVALYITELDLGFSFRCERHYLEALDQLRSASLSAPLDPFIERELVWSSVME